MASVWLFDVFIHAFLVPALVIFGIGLTYRIFKFILYRRVHEAKPEFRWREHVERYGGVVGYGFWHWIKELILVFIRPIWWTMKTREIYDFATGLTMLHMIGVLPILFLLGQHIATIWTVFLVPMFVHLAEPARGLLYTITAPLSMVSGFTHMPGLWGPLTPLLNGDLLALLALAAVCFKIGDHVIKVATRTIHMRVGDFLFLILVLLIIVTGIGAARHWGWVGTLDPVVAWKWWMGLHVLFAEILLMVLTYTKAFHLIFGYWYGKIHEFYDMAVKRGV